MPLRLVFELVDVLKSKGFGLLDVKLLCLLLLERQ